MLPKPWSKKRRLGVAILVSLALLLLAFWLLEFLSPRIWLDIISRQNYKVTSEIRDLTSRLDLTERARAVFWASNPRLETAAAFNQHCTRQEKTFLILGCYDNKNIFVYQVADPELTGVVETTAAHELLHAIYARLNYFTKRRIDVLLETDYQRLKTNELKERLAYYQRQTPEAFNDELHAILGTEFNNLSPELEAHYRQFFTNRAKIVKHAEAYQQKFKLLHQQAEALKQEILQMEQTLPQEQSTYREQLRQLNQDISQINHRAKAAYYKTQAQFQAERRLLIQRSQELEAWRQRLNQKITHYNHLIRTYNNNATQYQRLQSSLDSLTQTPEL